MMIMKINLGDHLTSPLGMLLVMPLLIMLTGVGVWVIADAIARRTSQDLTEQAMAGDQTRHLDIVATIAGQAAASRRQSQIQGGIVILLGMTLSVLYAIHLGRIHRETADQYARVLAAEIELKQFGGYRLVRKLGEGGMGEVWLGMHRLLARPAAIKLITATRLIGGDVDEAVVDRARSRFSTEARITASLRSRNTIELYDYGVSPDGSFFYVMELLDGIDLRNLVERHGPQPIGRIIHLLLQVCNSLAEAHDRGLVHRDIKPENIYVCRRADEVDVVKVLDFGIVAVQSRELSSKVSKAGIVVGTPSTMSPEQARGEELDGRSDLYALGCVAYWLLTGNEVFPVDDSLAQIFAHLSTEPEPPSVGAGRPLPPELDLIVLSCLSKLRHKRPADARALAAVLRTIPIPAEETRSDTQALVWWDTEVPLGPTGVFDKSGIRKSCSPT